MMHYRFVLLAALSGYAATTPCPPKWLVEGRSSWISASTRLDKVLAAMPTLYPGGLTAPPNATATATGSVSQTAGISSTTVSIDEVSSTKTDSSTISVSPTVAAGDSASDSNASSTDEVLVTSTTTTITTTPSASTSATTTSTSTTTASTGKDTEEDSGLDRRDENVEDFKEQTDEDETLETRTQQAALKLKDAYELQELFDTAVLEWGRAQEEQEILRKELRNAQVEIKRRIRAAVNFAREVQAEREAAKDEEEREKTDTKEEEKLKKASKRDEVNDCGCGNKNEKRTDRLPMRDIEHEKQEDELYANIGKQLEFGLEKKEEEEEETDTDDYKPLYLITKQFKVYKCQKPNGCDLYDIKRSGRGRDDRHGLKGHKNGFAQEREDFRQDVKKHVQRVRTGKQLPTFNEIEQPKKKEKEKKKERKYKDEEKEKPKGNKEEEADTKSKLLAGGDEKKQYERISALYMQYRSLLVKPIQKDLDPILKNSNFEEDKEMAAQYKEGNEKEQRERLAKLYMGYRYMLVPKWQAQLDPVLYTENY